jgi:heterodisulfide reductase subunit B
MKYLYYPGCSLEGTAREYNVATRAVLTVLGAELRDLEDWTCCGSSPGEVQGYLLALVLAARNLALGEDQGVPGDFLVPCSSCYLNLRRVEDHVARDKTVLPKINAALLEEGLQYRGLNRVRHLMDVLANDFKPVEIRARVKHELSGLKVAPYYGCQALRPYGSYDDPEKPRSMEPLLAALGAQVFPWEMGPKCCGAGLMTTKKEVALELTGAILKAAKGADCIVTICPMCQMNLEAFQGAVSSRQGESLGISILYLPQLMGLAFGLSAKEILLGKNLALTKEFKRKLGT